MYIIFISRSKGLITTGLSSTRNHSRNDIFKRRHCPGFNVIELKIWLVVGRLTKLVNFTSELDSRLLEIVLK